MLGPLGRYFTHLQETHEERGDLNSYLLFIPDPDKISSDFHNLLSGYPTYLKQAFPENLRHTSRYHDSESV